VTTPTSRRLILMRHAKSDWPDVADRDRPLAARGRRDAPAAGRWLCAAGYVPDHVICSPARRTRETWDLVSGELIAAETVAEPAVVYDERVYDASVFALLWLLREAPDAARTLMLVGHNPGMQELTLSLTGETAGEAARDAFTRARGHYPTSTIAVLDLAKPWSDLVPGNALLTDLVVPRG
jgi:phosphohistidine phosphatase